MTTVIVEGNVIGNGTLSSGSASYDSVAYFNVPSTFTNNMVNSTSTGYMLSFYSRTNFSNNTLSGSAVTAVLSLASGSDHLVSGNKFSASAPTVMSTVVSAKITGNKFSSGSTYLLDISGANCTVFDNDFDTPGASSTMLRLHNSSSLVSTNKFTRSATSITSYVTISGTSGNQVVDNVFDSSTTDGTTETIVSGITDSDTVVRNKNQIHYVTVFPIEAAYSHDVGATTTHELEHYSFTNASLYYAGYGTITTALGIALSYHFIFTVNLSKVLPKGARLLESLVGFRLSTIGSNINTGSSAYGVTSSLRKTISTRPINTDFSSPASTLAAVTTTTTSFLDSAIGTTSSASSTPDTTIRYLNGDYTGLNVVVNDTQDVIYVFQATIPLNTTSATSNYQISNFLFKYII